MAVITEADRVRADHAMLTGELSEAFGSRLGRLPVSEVARALSAHTRIDWIRMAEAMQDLGFVRERARYVGEMLWVYARGVSIDERRLALYLFRDPITGTLTAGYLPDQPRGGRL